MIFIRLGILVLFIFYFISAIFAISFNVDNPQTEDDVVNITISLSGFTSLNCASSSACYLQGALQKPSGGDYFGATRNNKGEWYSCKRTQDKDVIKSNFFSFFQTNGNWSGTLSMKAEVADGYIGPGNYILKVWRYTGNSDNPAGESNEVEVYIAQPTLTPTNTPSSIPENTNTPTCTHTPTPAATSKPTNTSTLKPTEKGTATPTQTLSEASQSSDLTKEKEDILGAKTENVATSSVSMERAASRKVFIITFLFIGIGCAGLSLAIVLKKQFFPT